MKKFSLKNVGMLFILTLFISVFASQDANAQYVTDEEAFDILMAETETAVTTLSSYSVGSPQYNYEVNRLYYMKHLADIIISDAQVSVSNGLDISLTAIGFKNHNSPSGSISTGSTATFTDLPSLSANEYQDIRTSTAGKLQ